MSKVIDLFGKDYEYVMLVEMFNEDLEQLEYVGEQAITFNYTSDEMKNDFELFHSFVSRVLKRLECETGLTWQQNVAIYSPKDLEVETTFTDTEINYDMELKFTFIAKN